MSQHFQSGRLSLILIFLLGCATIAGLWFFKPKPAMRPPAKSQTPVVDVILAEPQAYQVTVSTQGTVEAKRQINIIAEVSGRVVEVNDNFVSGGFFKAGDALVKLDDRDYRYALLNAEAQVANAERELALEKGQARQAKRVWRDLGSAEANSLSLREPQVNAALAAVKAAKADQQKALLNIQRTAVSVPFDGRVESASVDLGQFVVSGSQLGNVFDSSVAEVRLPLSNEQLVLAGLIPGAGVDQLDNKKVVLTTTLGGQDFQWQAKLTRVEAVVDSRTRFFHVVAEVAQPFNLDLHDRPLVMGLFVEAKLSGRQIENAISIPKKAMISQQVFVVTSDNKLNQRKLTIVDRVGDHVWVQADIQEGEKIVVSDPRILSEGMEVRVSEL